MDEMKMKSDLTISKSSGKVAGFCELEAVNSELTEMALFEKTKSAPELASHILV